MRKVQLRDLCYARSGDKGDTVNVGLLAKDATAYDLLRRHLTPEKIKSHFGAMVRGPVEIYEMPNIQALNVVLRQALDGGASRTLRLDQTGKAMGSALLRMEIELD
ncbi:MAG: hypothetical protein HYT87_06020 [Nitrospirae bacterium]|nr:hypothetical protein [Nitrospirota bacterium]